MSNNRRDTILVWELPLTEPQDYKEERRFFSKGGEFAQIVNEHDADRKYAHIAYWSSPEGGRRGDHMHNKPEFFYVVSGELELHSRNVDSGRCEMFQLRKGSRVYVPARVAHYFLSKQDSQVIEFHSEPYSEADTTRYQASDY